MPQRGAIARARLLSQQQHERTPDVAEVGEPVQAHSEGVIRRMALLDVYVQHMQAVHVYAACACTTCACKRSWRVQHADMFVMGVHAHVQHTHAACICTMCTRCSVRLRRVDMHVESV